MSDSNPTEDLPVHPDSELIPPASSPQRNVSYRVEPRKTLNYDRIAKVALAVALIGSFLPWARVLFFTVNGTDGDGIITAAASGLALFLVFVGARRMTSNQSAFGSLAASAISATLAAGVYIYDFVNLTSISEESSNEFFEVSVQPQIGLIGGSVGAVVGALSCMRLALVARRTLRAN